MERKMKLVKIGLIFVVLLGLLCAVVLLSSDQVQYEENTPNVLVEKLTDANCINLYQTSNGVLLASITNTDWIADFVSAVEFEDDVASKIVEVRMPSDYDLVFTGVTTQRLHLVADENYLRSSSGILVGDVKLTEESTEKIRKAIHSAKVSSGE